MTLPDLLVRPVPGLVNGVGELDTFTGEDKVLGTLTESPETLGLAVLSTRVSSDGSNCGKGPPEILTGISHISGEVSLLGFPKLLGPLS